MRILESGALSVWSARSLDVCMFFMAKHIPSDSDLQSVNGGRRLPRVPRGPKPKPVPPRNGSGQGGNKTPLEISPEFDFSHHDSHDTVNYNYYGDSE